MEALIIDGIERSFKNVKALKGVSFSVEEGTVFALLGENGAGKTTLIKILCGLYKKDGGTAKILGYNLDTEGDKIRPYLSVCPQETSIDGNLTVRENLKFSANIYGLYGELANKKINEVENELNLSEVSKRLAKKLSGGTQRRLAIGMSIVCSPKILFLDEPTVGLDVKARRELWKVIKSLKEKTTVILTTHYLEEAEALSDKTVILSEGKVCAEGTVQEIKKFAGTEDIEEAFIRLTGGEL